jgi:putative ABC transport system permease protein
MNSWLENFAYRIKMSWWMIAGSGGFAFLLALIITHFHAVKAGLQNPVTSLRTE